MTTYNEKDLKEIYEEGARTGIHMTHGAFLETQISAVEINRGIENARARQARLGNENFAKALRWLNQQEAATAKAGK